MNDSRQAELVSPSERAAQNLVSRRAFLRLLGTLPTSAMILGACGTPTAGTPPATPAVPTTVAPPTAAPAATTSAPAATAVATAAATSTGELRVGVPVAIGYESLPDVGEGPGVLVLHAWWGLNDFFRSVCDRLAGAGFVVVAPDLWGGTVATTVEEAERLLQQRDDEAMRRAVEEAIAHLRAHPAVRGERLGALGFSLGAAQLLDVAGSHPELEAIVLFYGVGQGDFGAMRAAVLGHFAENDPWEPERGVRRLEEALREAGREVQFHRYPGVGHWFVEEDRPDAYNPPAASQAWERTLSFLGQRLG